MVGVNVLIIASCSLRALFINLSMVDISFFDSVKIFGILYFVGFGVMYYLSKRNLKPLIIPGDIYKTNGGRITYVPTGGAFLVAIVLYILLVRVIPKIFGA